MTKKAKRSLPSGSVKIFRSLDTNSKNAPLLYRKAL
jgi:hypothetical protein